MQVTTRLKVKQKFNTVMAPYHMGETKEKSSETALN
jgi:hypothetical protein